MRFEGCECAQHPDPESERGGISPPSNKNPASTAGFLFKSRATCQWHPAVILSERDASRRIYSSLAQRRRSFVVLGTPQDDKKRVARGTLTPPSIPSIMSEIVNGGVAEWLKAAVLKTARVNSPREFESHPHRTTLFESFVRRAEREGCFKPLPHDRNVLGPKLSAANGVCEYRR